MAKIQTIDYRDLKPILEAFRAQRLTADQAVAAIFKAARCCT
jgi:hypothetical protein